jgi:hypothetical protein
LSLPILLFVSFIAFLDGAGRLRLAATIVVIKCGDETSRI